MRQGPTDQGIRVRSDRLIRFGGLVTVKKTATTGLTRMGSGFEHLYTDSHARKRAPGLLSSLRHEPMMGVGDLEHCSDHRRRMAMREAAFETLPIDLSCPRLEWN
jgi:hypothetical protein